MAKNEEILTVMCDSARDFLERARALALDPPWGIRRRDRWAFRGQMNSEWALVPAAYRPGTKLGYGSSKFTHVVTGDELRGYTQGQAEFYVVHQYLQLADRVGLSVPGDNQLFREDADVSNVVGHKIGTHDWPPTAVYETLAICQHHGVPTRLLDFSYSYRVASWFPANEIVTKVTEKKNARMALWALDMDTLFYGMKHDWGSPFVKITVPRASNRFLHAQEGFFLHCKNPDHMGTPPSFECAIAKVMDEYRNRPIDDRWPGLDPICRAGFKFELDTSEAVELFKLLHLEGIDEAHLRPTLDNVVKTLCRKEY